LSYHEFDYYVHDCSDDHDRDEYGRGHDHYGHGHDHYSRGHDHFCRGHDHFCRGHDHFCRGHDHFCRGHDHFCRGHDDGRGHDLDRCDCIFLYGHASKKSFFYLFLNIHLLYY
jgi:hypothetical protein